MRGQGATNIIASNIAALSAQQRNERRMNNRRKCCWKCQKDKFPYGGFIDLSMGIHKFICKDCMEAKKKK